MENSFSRTYCTRGENIKIAEAVLKRIFNDPLIPKAGITVKTVYFVCGGKGLTRGEIKEARKNVGIISENRNGTQFWYLPEGVLE